MMRFGRKLGFTMIEMLVVIVIIGILVGSLAPVVGRFLTAGDEAVSRNNLMRLGRAALSYKGDKDGCYPAAGGYFTHFKVRNAQNREEDRYGRAAGWVYFEHDCPRKKGEVEAAEKIGSGNGNSYGIGEQMEDGSIQDDFVNEEDICTCYSSKSKEGGMGSKPASWKKSSGGDSQYSPAEVAIINGCLFGFMNKDLRAYSNPAFAKLASEKLKVPRNRVVRAYAMNVITGTDSDFYDLNNNRSYTKWGGSSNPGGLSAIRYGASKLSPYVDSNTRAEAMPVRTALFVELDVDNEAMASDNSLEGDQVWDWDTGDENMGFIHEDRGVRYAHVCFADGHVEAIRDPSRDSDSPDTTKRRKLSKWYGSGGLNSEAEKVD